MDDLLSVIRREGVEVIEVDGWRTRGRTGTFSPVGQINHHTAGGGTSDAPSLNICINGRTGIPGPLCNGLISRSAKLHLIGAGRANDSGMGRSDVLDLVRHDRAPNGRPTQTDDINGNAWFYDWEFENNGLGEVFSPAMMEVAYKINTAVARWKGWTGNRSIAHYEWTKRKPDPRGWNMYAFRQEIQKRLTHVVAPVIVTNGETMSDPVIQKGATGQAVRILQSLLIAHAEDLALWFSGGKLDEFVDGQFGDSTKSALSLWQERTQALTVNGVADQPVWDWLKRTQ